MLGIHTRPSLYRDFALLSALIVVMLVIVSLWIVYKTYQIHSEDVVTKLENEAVRIDRALIIEVERAAYFVESIGRQIEIEDAINLPEIDGLFRSFKKSMRSMNLEFYWINANQHIVLSSNGGTLDKPVDIADRDYMKRAITTPWLIHIGQPVEGRVSGNWVIPIAMGLTNDAGEFRGAVSISLDINALSQHIIDVIKNEHIHFAITNRAFTLLTEVSDQPNFFDHYFRLSRLSALNFEQKPSGVYSRDTLLDDDEIFAYYEHSTQYPYIIFVGFDAVTSNNMLYKKLLPRLVQIIIITIFLVMTLWTVRRRIIKPVVTLREHTANILKGQRFVHDSSNDPIEIEQLAQQIEQISEYIGELRRIEQELKRKNLELRHVKESAELTNELKAEFFEQVGDSLFQPARSIVEYSESLRSELFGNIGNDKYREIAEYMHVEVEHIIEALQDIKQISKAESGLLGLLESQIDFPFILKKSVRLLQEHHRLQHITIVQEVDEQLPWLRGDELRIKQLCINLILSIIREMDVNEPLRISAQKDPHELKIEFTYKPSPDMNPPFSGTLQLDQSTPQLLGFSRLGHALCELIVKMHDGEITTRTQADKKIRKVLVFPASRLESK